MTTHTLTTEQLEKFVDAVGGTSKSGIAGGQFTTAKLQELTESCNGLHDWPKITSDPLVNFAVDCVVAYGDFEKEPDYDEQLYAEEIEAFRAIAPFDD